MMRNKRKGCCGCLPGVIIAIAVIIVIVAIIGSDGGSAVKTAPGITPTAKEFNQKYAQLDDTEKNIYDTLLAEVQKGGLSVKITNIDFDHYEQHLQKAILAMIYDHPEYFWLNTGYSYSGFRGIVANSGSIEITLACYEYWSYISDPKKYTDALLQEVKRIAAEAKAHTNTFDQVQYVHDYLVENAMYDHEALAEAEKTFHSASSEYIYSAYGCLVNKRTVCSGYAKAFQLIMYELGINCTYVTGYAGERHGWNCVELDGEGYYVDVTWDDADWLNDDGTPQYPDDSEYDYFCITSAELKKTHTPEETLFEAPNCTAIKYNYFVYKDYRLPTYSLQGVADIVQRQIQQGQKIICVQFGSVTELEKAKEDLMTHNRYKQIPAMSGITKFRYNVDTDHLVLTLYL